MRKASGLTEDADQILIEFGKFLTQCSQVCISMLIIYITSIYLSIYIHNMIIDKKNHSFSFIS